MPGLTLWFNSNDHRPPHFHAEKTDTWEVRVFFLQDGKAMFETVWPMSKPPRAAELRALAKVVEGHRAELLEEWERSVNVKEPG